jgi:hypothetical protein
MRQVMEPSRALLDAWIANWTDIVDFEVIGHHVTGGAAIGPRL